MHHLSMMSPLEQHHGAVVVGWSGAPTGWLVDDSSSTVPGGPERHGAIEGEKILRNRIWARASATLALALFFAACDDGGEVSVPADAANGDVGRMDSSLPACGNNRLETGEDCDDGNTANGDGCSSTCQSETGPVCGNGTREGDEACDDGNTDSGDGCSSSCTAEEQPACGDGNVDAGEECDDGNTDAGDGCDATCQDEAGPVCGDGNVDAGEECDDGNTDAGDGCDATCQDEAGPTCGDGNVDAGEECDDGNTDAGDGCDATCQTEAGPTCGDGNVDAGEQCDDGNTDAGDGCDATCQTEVPPAVCGNGALEPGEGCDDGNLIGGDGCSAACVVELPCVIVDDCNAGQVCVAGFCLDAGQCGNGALEGAEQCDDGNQVPGDGCDAACQIEVPAPVCGNGVVEAGEDCDDGNVVGGDGCPANCIRGMGPVCGDGRVQMGEQCDDGNIVDGDGCNANCVIEVANCGNGAVEAPEQCDDGNRVDGDGCSALCLVEIPGAVCGDGTLDMGEQCDDGNLVAGDGCSPVCRIELPPAICGNAAVEVPEQCDDGNIVNGDGCSSACRFEIDCGNGEVQPGEVCDDGNRVNGDGCDTLCTNERFDIIVGAEVRRGGVPAESGDLYRFVVDHSQSELQAFTTGCAPGTDTTLTLFADNAGQPGAQIAFNDDAAGADGGVCSHIHLPIDAGVYYIRVAPRVGELVDYGLDFRLTADASAPGRFNGAFVARGNDLFVVNVAQAGGYAFETSNGAGGCSGDTTLTLFSVAADGTREEIGFDDDTGFGTCSLLNAELEAGSYELLAQGYNGQANAGYVLSVAVAGVCGDGAINIGEQCDPGADVEGDFCDAACQFIAGCGNARLDAGEQCDPGPDVEGDFCDAACQFLAGCGNGRLDAGEECDDANLVDGDGCTATCETEVFDIIQGIEQRNGGFGVGGSDTFRFVVDHDGSHLVISTGDGDGGCPGDTTLQILAADANGQPGEQVDFNDDAFQTCSLIDRALPAGTYYARVFGFNGAEIPAYVLDYRLEVDVSGGDGTYNGAVVVQGNDLYVLSHVGGVVRFETGGADGRCPGDTTLTLFRFDEAGARVQIAFNDDTAALGVCSRIELDLVPGDYEIVGAGFNNRAIPAYVLNVAFAGECGNGALEIGEECDDNNVVDGDGCAADCTIEPFCGDGTVDAGEQCDDRNNVAGDGCDPNCQFEQTCGNGDVEGLEACDDGNLVNGDGCSDVCEIEPGCGNGRLDMGETCDDGNLIDGDACDADCAVEPATDIAAPGLTIQLAGSLGDGDPRWARPLANCADQQPADHFYEAFRIVNNTGAAQRLTLTAAWLGDGFLHVYRDPPLARERCVIGDDDFNGVRGSQLVNVDIAAGQVLVVVASTYDGNVALGDYTVTILTQIPPAVCGNNVLEAPEACDDGNLDAGDGCAANCTLEPVCGNGQLEAGEGCDDGNLDNGDGCDSACVSEIPPAVCGNGAVEAGEQCDDGNLVNGDGCDSLCTGEVYALVRALQVQQGAIPATQRDRFTFTVDHTSNFLAFTGNGAGSCPAGVDTLLDLYSVNGADRVRVGGDDDSGEITCSRFQRVLNPGTYEIEVLDFGNDGAIPSYVLDFSLTVDVSAGGAFNGAIAQDGSDLYILNLGAEAEVELVIDNGAGACPAGVDTIMAAYVAGPPGVGVRVAINDDDLGLCSRIRQVFAPGAYQIEVIGFGGDPVPAHILNVRFPAPAACGNNVLDAGEQCDDGNILNLDGCDSTCRIEVIAQPIAAPGATIQLAGALEAGDPRWARPAAGCGNEPGVDHPFDFFRIVNNTGAARQLTVTAAWAGGDGYLHIFRDPFNPADLAGCVAGDDDFGNPPGGGSQLINVNIAAGEVLVVVASTFSPNANIGAYTIDVLTQLPPAVCGNGAVEAPEQCDDGNLVNTDACTGVCRTAVCGDTFVQAGVEACDDGNQAAGDGCSPACQVEQAVCGNNIVDGAEQCDDGNRHAGDGCSLACTFEVPTPIAAAGLTVQLAGALEAADPRWARASAACANEAGADHPYDAYRIVNNTGAAQQLTITATWAAAQDGFLHVYGDPLNAPAAPAGCVIGNDDFGANGSRVTNVNIAAGQVLVVVASTYFGNQNIGAYTLDVLTQVPPAVCGNNVIEAPEQCDDGNLVNTDACTGVCRTAVCGDTFVQAGVEACDDGNVAAGDGCSPACQVEQAVCGNSIVEAGEQCDDGARQAGDGCSPACQNEPAPTPIAARGATVQFAGAIEAGDPLWARPSAACVAAPPPDHPYDAHRIVNNTGVAQQVTITAAWAADGFLHVFNAPFDATAVPAGCVIGSDDFNGALGSRVVNVNIAPDQVLVVVASTFSPNTNIGAYTLTVLTQVPPAVCGNGAVEAPEQCDDGNLVNTDACTGVCRTAVCGDTFIQAGVEACDDGNVAAGDGCSPACQIEQAVCGNNIVEGAEQCDDGNRHAGDGCSLACALEVPTPIAAVGQTVRLQGGLAAGDPTWARPSAACAAGAAPKFYDAFRIVNNTGAAQQLTVTAAWTGGDGFLHVFGDPLNAPAAPAGCIIGSDDFNGAAGSQVTNVNIAAGQTLVVVASTFSNNAAIASYTLDVLTQQPPAVCGDGVVSGAEQCDDGNQVNTDACTNACRNAACGDTFVQAGVEQCDDGNQVNTDACTATCRTAVCGDGVVQANVDECDDGNLVNGDGCDAICSSERFDVITAVFRRASRLAVGSTDSYRFTIDDAGSVVAVTGDGTPNGLGCLNVGDTVLELYPVINGVRGALLLADNDSGADLCSRLVFPVLQPGVYDIVVREQGNDAALPAYTLDLFVAVDANGFGQFDGAYPANGSDGFLFTLNAERELLMFSGDGLGACPAGADTLLDLFLVNQQTGALQLVANDDDGGQGNCSQLQRVLAAGTYAAVVRGFGAAALPDYTFEIECLNCPADPVPPTPGSLVITEVMFNPAAVNDAVGEWFELQNVSDLPLNLNGLIVADDVTANERFTVAVDLIVQPGDFVVFGNNANQATNGGVVVDFAYPTANGGGLLFMSLGNATDGIIVVHGAAEIDRFIWGVAGGFPNPNGPSLQFDGDLDPAVDNNALPANWCISITPFGAGDLGTPGSANDSCTPLVEINIENFAMNPDPVTIQAGTLVRWTNLDPTTHTVTSGAPGAPTGVFDSGNLNQNQTFEFLFDAPGVYTYFCQPHAGFMFGYTITVNP